MSRIMWKCLCDCGNNKVAREGCLISGGTRSCGCLAKESQKRGKDSHLWKGCGELSGDYISYIKFRCNEFDREYSLSPEYAWDLFLKQGRKCALTGLPIEFATGREIRRGEKQRTASLDRIDSDKGYIKGNVQWVHKDVNLMKNHFPQDRFIEICRLIAARFPGTDDNQLAA